MISPWPVVIISVCVCVCIVRVMNFLFQQQSSVELGGSLGTFDEEIPLEGINLDNVMPVSTFYTYL